MEESDYVETLKKDLKHQLSFENIDWDYLIATAKQAREEDNKGGRRR